jgi:hypothetical protein
MWPPIRQKLRRDIVIGAIFVMPMLVHGAFHLMEYGGTVLAPIAWMFTSHDGPGFYSHIAVQLSEFVLAGFLMWRMIHYARLAEHLMFQIANLYTQLLDYKSGARKTLREIGDF